MIRRYLSALLLPIVFVPTSVWAQTQNTAAPSLTSRQLTLVQAEELLRLRSLALAANRSQLDASRAGRLIAGFKPNPVLTVGAQQFPFTSNVPGSVPRLVSTNPDAGANPLFTLHVDKIIERGGKREFRVEQANAIVDATTAQIDDTLRTQRFQLRQAFVAAMLARENLQLAAQLQDEYAQSVTLTAARVEDGDAAPVDLYRIQAASVPFQQSVIDAQNSYEQATRDLLNVLDVAPDDIPSSTADGPRRFDTGFVGGILAQEISTENPLASAQLLVEGTFSDKVITQSLADLHALALANRPDVLMARSAVRAAGASVRVADAQRTRDVAVGVEYQRVGNDQAVGATMQIPLFAYNNQRAGISQATALEQAAEAELRQAERQASTDVDKAYEAYLAAGRTLALYNGGNLKQVEDVRSIMTYSYRQSFVTLFELLDAERMERQTLVAYNQARAAYQLALYQVEEAVGVPLL